MDGEDEDKKINGRNKLFFTHFSKLLRHSSPHNSRGKSEEQERKEWAHFGKVADQLHELTISLKKDTVTYSGLNICIIIIYLYIYFFVVQHLFTRPLFFVCCVLLACSDNCTVIVRNTLANLTAGKQNTRWHHPFVSEYKSGDFAAINLRICLFVISAWQFK